MTSLQNRIISSSDLRVHQLISQSVKWWKLNNYNIFSNKEKQEVEFSSLKLVHSPKGLQMFSVDDVGDFWNTAAEDQTVLQPEVSINYSFLFYFFFLKTRTHRNRHPQTVPALARWSVWLRPLWRHGDDPADLWSHSWVQSAQVQSQICGGIWRQKTYYCSYTLLLHFILGYIYKYFMSLKHFHWGKNIIYA